MDQIAQEEDPALKSALDYLAGYGKDIGYQDIIRSM
jgi:hypothetical protein